MKISIFLASSLMIVALVIGLMFGYFLTPDYQSSMYDKSGMDLGVADRRFDQRYLNAMIAHHTGAMLLAQQLKQNTTRPELQTLANTILTEEPAAIDELYAWKKSWYKDSKKVPNPTVANLGSGDDQFDLRFLNAMIAHHQAGILMTQETRLKSSRSEVLNNADQVEEFLTGSLIKLKELRQTWYQI